MIKNISLIFQHRTTNGLEDGIEAETAQHAIVKISQTLNKLGVDGEDRWLPYRLEVNENV
jgi:hypothetical protein